MPPSLDLRMNHALPVEHRERLLRVGRETHFPQGARLFEEGGHANNFWIIRDGTAALDMHVPGRRPPVIETLGVGDLVGWSWLYEPFVWQLGAEALTPLRAHEFDAVAVRLMCLNDPEFGRAVEHWVGRVLAHRLNAARARLVDLYGIHETKEPR
ncbi:MULTISPECIES: cyclic nucleotide-binding domain-containing protein [unclassified Streptomyces]|uniref:Crp/Fnr family transcriptional regulator n=1 Tax=unclassified Streptomyces TaxID=2593676 RepID=UPI002365C1F4|nr:MULTISPECIES: cyclic nucleotide-binding domain-containing protein [unclassified Streptomyces]MDF3143000.1 cyclic nucleotide-binding domain-containing protein [Streptomyces sp. T21Q-yed]WDF43977.1 cyclic nucleotide-binding domain-containing protein [Streptomyces sp. T12]